MKHPATPAPAPRTWEPNPTQARVLEAVTTRVGPDAAEALRQSWIDAGLVGAAGAAGRADPLEAVTHADLVRLVRLSRRRGAGGWAARNRLRQIVKGRP